MVCTISTPCWTQWLLEPQIVTDVLPQTYKFDDLYKGKPRSPRVLVKQLVKNSKVENKITLGGRIPARDGLHMTVHEQKLIGNNFLYLKDRYPNGYIQEIPYKQEFLEKIFPRSVGK